MEKKAIRLSQLRIDPPGRGPGTIRLRNIRLESEGGELIKEWF